MFYALGENSEILRGGGIHPLPLYVRGLSMKCDMNNHLIIE